MVRNGEGHRMKKSCAAGQQARRTPCTAGQVPVRLGMATGYLRPMPPASKVASVDPPNSSGQVPVRGVSPGDGSLLRRRHLSANELRSG